MADKLGVLGAAASEAGQAPEPEAATEVAKESEGWASAPSGVDHGVMSEATV